MHLQYFLLRQFIMGIPNELEEAAVMDGASPIKSILECHTTT